MLREASGWHILPSGPALELLFAASIHLVVGDEAPDSRVFLLGH